MSSTTSKGAKKSQTPQSQPQGKPVEGANDSINVAKIVENGDKYIEAIAQHIDNLEKQWSEQDNVDLMPTPFFMSMLFLEGASCRDGSFAYDLAVSLKDAPDSVQNSVKKDAPSLHAWAQSTWSSKVSNAAHVNAPLVCPDIANVLESVNVTEPLPPMTSSSFFRKSNNFVRQLVEKYYPGPGQGKTTPEERKELFKRAQTTWMKLADAYKSSKSIAPDTKKLYPKAWERTAICARISQLAFLVFELNLQKFHVTMDEALKYFPGPGAEKPANKGSKERNVTDIVNDINAKMMKHKEESEKLHYHLKHLTLSWE